VGKKPILRTAGLTKKYGSVEALVNVSIELFAGEVTALVGDNGAGKSTLIKCISASIFPTSGEIFLDGAKINFRNPSHARDAGIETVYQQLALIDTFDIPGNIYLGRELKKSGIRGLLGKLNRKAMREAALKSIEDFGARFPDLTAAVETMSGGQRQIVAMTRGAHWGSKLLLLDEPTAALGVRESKSVLEIIEKFRSQQDKCILIVSHNLDHVWRVCDRILILRRGSLIADLRKSETTKSDVVAHITGAYEA